MIHNNTYIAEYTEWRQEVHLRQLTFRRSAQESLQLWRIFCAENRISTFGSFDLEKKGIKCAFLRNLKITSRQTSKKTSATCFSTCPRVVQQRAEKKTREKLATAKRFPHFLSHHKRASSRGWDGEHFHSLVWLSPSSTIIVSVSCFSFLWARVFVWMGAEKNNTRKTGKAFVFSLCARMKMNFKF